ncbi:MAG: hypothetical protein IT445_20340 [Phycisphaeraceae bacterium]|nr:hypothetical protein [Phycisphaeraceae bacterium]
MHISVKISAWLADIDDGLWDRLARAGVAQQWEQVTHRTRAHFEEQRR